MRVGYFYEGFIAIQRAVDMSIMSELGGMPAAPRQNIVVQLKSFPYPPYHNDVFIAVLQLQLPFMIMLSFIVTAPVICKDVVLEKEQKLKVYIAFLFVDGCLVLCSVWILLPPPRKLCICLSLVLFSVRLSTSKVA